MRGWSRGHTAYVVRKQRDNAGAHVAGSSFRCELVLLSLRERLSTSVGLI